MPGAHARGAGHGVGEGDGAHVMAAPGKAITDDAKAVVALAVRPQCP
ncbi:hypothetical protein LC55x_3899 [Lysobacter capsici]|nr:hypothetical protein LC55x_3899 [Lysobacter capsici]